MDRRDFLKTAGLGSVAFLAGCNSHPERHLYTLVKATEDMVTGKGLWYASTCRECPAGCGILAKNREGRIVKLEGNPLHPLNRGKLCARGQAALQHLYNPDQITSPLLKKDGKFTAISFPDALALAREKMQTAAGRGTNHVAMLSGVVGETMGSLVSFLLSQYDAGSPLFYEPLAYESLKFAHQQVFGNAHLPTYRMAQADVIVGFGADFLETWLSPVFYARQFKAMHAVHDKDKGVYWHISPYQGLTAANADRWLSCRPGGEAAAAMGLMHLLIKRRRTDTSMAGEQPPTALLDAMWQLAEPYTPEKAAALSGLPIDAIQHIARSLAEARHPLVLPTSAFGSGDASTAADMATVWINVLLNARLPLYDFKQRHRVEAAHRRGDIVDFWQQLSTRPDDVLLLNSVDPLHSMPGDIPIDDIFSKRGPFIIAISRVMNETTAAADLILPVQHPLLSWGAYEGANGVTGMLQPTMGLLDKAPSLGDLCLQLWPADGRPAASYRDYLFEQLKNNRVISNQDDWTAMVQQGGRFITQSAGDPPQAAASGVNGLARSLAAAKPFREDTVTLQVVPSIRMFDGRNADQSWLREMPEPVTQVAWQSPAMVHPSILSEHGWQPGQVVNLNVGKGRLQLPLYDHPGMAPGVVAVAMGQGLSSAGGLAGSKGGNPMTVISGITGVQTGAPVFAAPVSLSDAGRRTSLASPSGSRFQLGRKIALSVQLSDIHNGHSHTPGLTMQDFPFTPPLPEGYDAGRDIYPPHDHVGYRWGMAVDLDRCIGCSACVAACYAENNVGVVGEEQIVKGREMAWLRIERYQAPDDPTRLIFLPMMCQHCDNAPCESVCPVYAPHHSKEGLNNQIYNRCIGTRFCAQNCPYKVRRFNWYEWQWPEPLNLQLNPDVTVRSKGVMEKCSFCVQRIKDAHNQAKNENRAIQDGDIVPACVQTCPTDAIVFGDWMDPASQLRRMVDDPRGYQVLGYLNTKPAVVYLKKVTQDL